MSRCFPYPPPGYALSRASQEALIESIKLQKEREKAEEHRQKKREKKEKKKEKKEKKEHRKMKKEKKREKKDKKSGDQISQKFFPDTKDGKFVPKACEPESEQLEKSSVTEEHGKPVCLRVPSSSSDSTENSNKRKRDSSPIDSSRSHGKIIRIRLSSKKLSPPEASANGCSTSFRTANECSTSGRTPVSTQRKDDISLRQRSGNLCSTSAGTSNKTEAALPHRNSKEQTSEKTEVAAARKTSTPPVSFAAMTPIQRAALQYNNLIEKWVPPQLSEMSLDGDDDDSDWLFKDRKQEKSVAEKRTLSVNESVSCSSSSTLWPRAQYLREVDVYALPYTVPF